MDRMPSLSALLSSLGQLNDEYAVSELPGTQGSVALRRIQQTNNGLWHKRGLAASTAKRKLG